MNSLILRTALRYILPLLLLFSVFLLLRGHNEPGGGFAGGLLGATTLAMYVFAWNPESARQALAIAPHVLIGTGLLVALAAGASALVRNREFMSASWVEFASARGPVALGTPLLFDVGVCLVVVGATGLIILSFAER